MSAAEQLIEEVEDIDVNQDAPITLKILPSGVKAEYFTRDNKKVFTLL